MPHLTWLHLSDLHHCERSGWDAFRVLTTLKADLQSMADDHGLRPDFLLFSGDVVYGTIGVSDTLERQYKGAASLLHEIRTTFVPPIDASNVFIVPGNHDVNRAKVTIPQISYLDKAATLEEVLDCIRTADLTWQGYMARLYEYQQFLEAEGYTHLLEDPGRLVYSCIRELCGRRIGVSGFNSAWSCARNSKDEKAKLWLGYRWQTEQILRNQGNVDVGIALIHHPTNWFTEDEDPEMGTELGRDYTFVLHGHEHRGWINQTAHNGHVCIAAGACYDRSDKPNGYSFVRIDLESGEGEVWLRRYEKRGPGWVAHHIPGLTDESGRHELQSIYGRTGLASVALNSARSPIAGAEAVSIVRPSRGLVESAVGIAPILTRVGTDTQLSQDSPSREPGTIANPVQDTPDAIVAQSQNAIASTLIDNGQPKTARSILQKARIDYWDKVPPKLRAKIANNQGAAELALGNYEGARQFFLEGSAYEPELQKIRANLATAHLLLGEYEDALKHATEVLEKESTNDQAASVAIQALYRAEGNEVVQRWVGKTGNKWMMVSPACLLALATVAFEEKEFAVCEDLINKSEKVGSHET
jgi:tetratricopeptide (TPR) repeat protein